MKKKQFSIDINATKEKVWNSLWEDANYRKWTSVFSPGSYAKSDWNEGDKILFLSPKGEGMYSVIDRKIEYEVMSFKHIGVIKDNIEQPLDEETKKWSGAMESYTLHERDGKTHLTAEIDLVDEHAEYFEKVFPEALKLVKEIAEN